jgi:transcription-repair coupling factor (superfamily II helicase)
MIAELQSLLGSFEKVYDLTRLAKSILNTNIDIFGLGGSSKALFCAALFRNTENGVLLVTKSNRDASDLAGDLAYFVDEQSIYLIPSKETLPYDDSEPFREFSIKRIVALSSLLEGKKGIYILPVRSLVDYYPPVEVFKQAIFSVAQGSKLDVERLPERLALLGYQREERVYYPGSFALRGDIIDVFSFGSDQPHRLEFFDDTLESVRAFTPSTQRSSGEVRSAVILPANEVVLTGPVLESLKKKKNPDNLAVVEKVEERGGFPGLENYLSLIYESPATLTDYAGGGQSVVFDSLEECRLQAEFFTKEAQRIYEERRSQRYLLPPRDVIAPMERLLGGMRGRADMISLPGAQPVETAKMGAPKPGLSGAGGALHFDFAGKKGYSGQIGRFREDIAELLAEGYTVIVGAAYEGQTNRLRELLKDLQSSYARLSVATLDLTEGFSSKKMKLAVVLDREIFNRKKRYKRLFLDQKSKPIEGILDIAEGDYIVHIEHGIGVFRGIEKLTTGGVEKDFIKIDYRDGDEIFIPVDQINLLQKYIGQEGRIPRVDKLGTDTWKKVKEHVKRSVRSLAKELLGIYSARASLQGTAYPKDTEWQHEFESGFRYEETPDQLKAVDEIKADMEGSTPMDRLVCGDVGFGKTEVAIRAAFKAVMGGKQVAVLVPTTILAEQHLNTFKDRFALYPVTVEMLSRFKTPKEQKIIVNNLKNGVIDVVIGTHRLIQKDVQFKDLGLVIIDEEQRFGVEHKEKLKALRTLVDVITLTATPIPRTLYMAMTRIRDMSVIETPPRDRIPIETYVMDHSEEEIVKAIRREVERGGQVYYVHNRVRTIEEKSAHLRLLMPDVTFETAHGQMDEDQLEDIMQAFFNQEFQVLVTTTIIESGLDIPNVNTIVIERADRFGLSQLYQLRGRVGRSKRKAYAYLMYPSESVLTEQARKRLQVIGDHTELGSGFSIAMKDLEIRGAGNLLGREQHGDMLAVGFEMYVKLLDEAIRDIKEGRSEEIEIDPVLDVKYRGYIPTSYIDAERLRIEVYKRLASLKSEEELKDLREELGDRYGALPSELDELFRVVEIKVLCRNVGIKLLREKESELLLTFEKSKVDIIRLIQKVNRNKRLLSISPKDYNTLTVYRGFHDNAEKLSFLKDLFDYEESA